MVRCASKLRACLKRLGRRARVPENTCRTSVARRRTSSRTTASTMRRASASTSGFIRCLVRSTALSSVALGSMRDSTVGSVTTSWISYRSTASRSSRSMVSLGNSRVIWSSQSTVVRTESSQPP